jgi:biotin carboxylase
VAVLREVLHKRRARQILRRHGLSRLETVPGAVADRWKQWPDGKRYYFKSCFGSGKRGVAGPLDGLQGLAAARADWLGSEGYCSPIQHAFLHRADNEYYLEEEFPGADLLSVEGLWQGGRFHVLGLWSRFLDWPASRLQEMGGVFPWPHPQRGRIVALVEAAHRALGVSGDAGPTHTEVLVRPDRAEVCEVNHRFGGDELVQCVSLALEADVPAALLDWAAGSRRLALDLTPRRYVGMQLLYAPPDAGSVFRSMTFPDDRDVVYRLQYVSPGTPLGDPTRSASQIGNYLVAAPTFEAAAARARALRSAVRVNGVSAAY